MLIDTFYTVPLYIGGGCVETLTVQELIRCQCRFHQCKESEKYSKRENHVSCLLPFLIIPTSFHVQQELIRTDLNPVIILLTNIESLLLWVFHLSD